jgi:MYXO-CTERM domain-containing protein
MRSLPLLLLAMLFSPAADATVCTNRAGQPVVCDGSVRTGTLTRGGTNSLAAYTCDVTDPGGIIANHNGPDAIHEFDCPYTGSVTLHVDSTICQFDLFVLDSCAANDCAFGWDESTNSREVTVDCTIGQTYWLIVEGYNLANGPVLAPCGVFGDFNDTYEVYAECDEVCTDRVDNDFDGLIDLVDPDCCDLDGDGRDATTALRAACSGTDCNDNDASIYSGAPEVIGDGIDQSCNSRDLCYRDNDRDGFGTNATSGNTIQGDIGFTCSQVAGKSANNQDCNDASNAVFPNAAEIVADGVDQDCNLVDLCYVDADADNFGNAAGLTALGSDLTCADEATVDDSRTDCADGVSGINPAANEVCNGVDDDCDGLIDDADSLVTGAPLWYQDIDGDGYAGSSSSLRRCTQPVGYFALANDCNDANATTRSIYPGASEVAADGIDQDCDGRDHCWVDQDGDTFGGTSSAAGNDMTCGNAVGESAVSTDCRDTGGGAAQVFPGQTETCNSIDDDCDALIDDADPSRSGGSTWYADADGDGYAGSTSVIACLAPPGASVTSTDCLDVGVFAPSTYPGAAETPADGLDQNCDLVDDCWVDQDLDGFGGLNRAAGNDLVCGNAPGESTLSTDCVDTGAGASGISPVAAEVCDGVDNDCDGLVDDADPNRTGGSVWFRDADGDGFAGSATSVTACSQPVGYFAAPADCLDAGPVAPFFFPGAAETPADGLDQDCDGADDCYVDLDGDSFGGALTSAGDNLVCGDILGESANTLDCVDSGAGAGGIFPGAPETCDNVDDDCDGLVDDADPDRAGGTLWYRDQDGDGFAGSSATIITCQLPSGYAGTASDCLDTGPVAPSFYPGAPETPADGLDQDCDGVDHCFADLDGDGFGGSTSFAGDNLVCGDSPGESGSAADCVDEGAGASGIFPGAPETCDAVDDDCDALIDDADPDRVGGSLWYQDADGDGFAGSGVTTAACARPFGYQAEASDCLDVGAGANAFFPGAPETTADGLDQDCDGVDACYVDRDLDGYGGASAAAGNDLVCGNAAGESSRADDCLDEGAGASSVNPGAQERCDGIDDDCDTLVDDGDPTLVGAPTWLRDFDGDGHAGAGGALSVCVAPSGYYASTTDCDDARADIGPDVPEACNGYDDDCDGLVDDGDTIGTTILVWRDADADGFGDANAPRQVYQCTPPAGSADNDDDCDDAFASVAPGALEVPYDQVDQDCDGADLIDVDGDGVAGGGFGGDCVDVVPNIRPGVVELADGVDEDCDGVVDDGTSAYDDDHDGAAEAGGDCDDSSVAIGLGAPELCDGVDQDCDGITDEGTACYDDDGDGFDEQEGDCHDGAADVFPGASEVAGQGVDSNCDGVVFGGDRDGDGYLAPQGNDCDDSDPDRRPGAAELPDGVDQDCDGMIDEGTVLADDDLDGRSEATGDCNDADPLINPLAVEIVGNRRDDDCDGTMDEGGPFVDDDGDGFTDDAGDCNDTNAAIRPYGEESDDGLDNDCDGQVDDGIGDFDGDGWTVAEGDCDDVNGYANPEADETCDLADNDCDEQVDEGCEGRTEDTGGDKDPGTGGGGCDCDHTPAPTGFWAALVGFAAALRRRSRR